MTVNRMSDFIDRRKVQSMTEEETKGLFEGVCSITSE